MDLDPTLVATSEVPAEPLTTRMNGEGALIAELETQLTVPTHMVDRFRQMQADRDYVRKDCMLLGQQDTVAVNLVLRNQYAGQAFLGVSAPEPEVQAARTVGGLINPVTERFAETMECHLSRQAKLMRLGEKVEGWTQDTCTQSIAWLKVTLQADFAKDPIGRSRFNDQQDTVMELLALQTKQREGKILPETADALRLADLEKTVRIYLAGKMEEGIKAVPVMTTVEQPILDINGMPQLDPMTGAPMTQLVTVPDPTDPRELSRQAMLAGVGEINLLGVPEIPHYLGFTCDAVLPEDIRYDWTITRPEDFEDARWMAHRVYMAPSEVYAKFQVERQDLKGAELYSDAGHKLEQKYACTETEVDTVDPTHRQDLDAAAINGRMAIWEVWHRTHGRRYVFAAGAKEFLINEVPQAVGRRWFPFFPLVFNRVTGQADGVSDVLLQRPSQDEYNTLRSHQREARRAGYPVVFVPKNWLDKQAQELYRQRSPFSVIEVDNPEEVSKHLAESVTVPYNKEAFDTSECRSDLQAMAGIPAASTGSDSNDTATATALAKEGLEFGVTRRRTIANRALSSIFQYMAEISMKIWPESYMQEAYGPAAVFPRLTAEEMYAQIAVEVRGGLSGKPRAKEQIDLMMNFATICQTLQLPVNGVEVLKDLLSDLGVRRDFRRYIGQPIMPGPMGVPSPAMAPEAQGDMGDQGGAPTMAERGAPNSVQEVPNHPGRQMPLPPPGPGGG